MKLRRHHFYACRDCNHAYPVRFGKPLRAVCPECRSERIGRIRRVTFFTAFQICGGQLVRRSVAVTKARMKLVKKVYGESVLDKVKSWYGQKETKVIVQT